MRVSVRTGPETVIHSKDGAWEALPVGVWVHYGFAWDGAGIEGGADTLRTYRDGDLVAAATEPFESVYDRCCYGYTEVDCENYPETYQVRIMSHHEFGRVGYSFADMDNLVVYDYPKTDFSDRFVEAPF